MVWFFFIHEQQYGYNHTTYAHDTILRWIIANRQCNAESNATKKCKPTLIVKLTSLKGQKIIGNDPDTEQADTTDKWSQTSGHID